MAVELPGIGVELTNLPKVPKFVFASLPAAQTGMLAVVTDSNTVTWGATIAGSGANTVLAFYDGSNWTVAGK